MGFKELHSKEVCEELSSFFFFSLLIERLWFWMLGQWLGLVIGKKKTREQAGEQLTVLPGRQR